MNTNTRQIRVLFLQPHKRDHFINRVVAFISPPFHHVEIEFDMSDNVFRSRCIASSIYNGESVFLRERSFSNPLYTILTFTVNENDFNKMLNYCRHMHQTGASFDGTGMYLSILPFHVRTQPPDKTFCSAYITRILRIGRVLEDTRIAPENMTPSNLYKQLCSCKRQCFSTVKSKMQCLDGLDASTFMKTSVIPVNV